MPLVHQVTIGPVSAGHGATSPNPSGSTDVWVIQLHGTFICMTRSVPARGLAPQGTAVALIINASTFEGYDFTITRQPHDLSKLGAVVQLPA
jgi:hypothetical protein